MGRCCGNGISPEQENEPRHGPTLPQTQMLHFAVNHKSWEYTCMLYERKVHGAKDAFGKIKMHFPSSVASDLAGDNCGGGCRDVASVWLVCGQCAGSATLRRHAN